MSKESKLTERTAGHVDNVVVSKPKVEGYLAFYRTGDMTPWVVSFPTTAIGAATPYCPSPLFPDRAKAIAKTQEMLVSGGEIMLFKVAE